MSTLAERLKEVMAGPPKISQVSLAKACGVKPPSVSDWLSGETKRLEGMNLLRAAEFLNVSQEWLATGRGPKEPGNLSRTARPVVAFDDEDPLEDDMVSVPCLELKLSAGSGRLEWEVDHVGQPNRYRRDWIIRRRFNPDKLTTVKVTGDSMYPGITDGAAVTLDTASTHLRNGKRYAIDYLGEFYIKRLFKNPDGSILVRSDNADKSLHPDWTITVEHGDSVRILGLLVGVTLDTDG